MRVSVIIPTFNQVALLRQTVDSVLAQTQGDQGNGVDIETVVVDDGSTDDTPALLANYGSRIVVVRQQNQGGAAARNRGLQVATGELINFLDHDDLFSPDKLAKQVAFLHAHPTVDVVNCRHFHIDDEGNRIDVTGIMPSGDVLDELLRFNLWWSGASLIRRPRLDQAGPFDSALQFQDFDLWMRLYVSGATDFGCIQEPLGSYRVHRHNLTADPARVESEFSLLLGKLWAYPGLPPRALAQRDAVLGQTGFYTSCQYFLAGQWGAAQRTLRLAVQHDPALRDDLPNRLLNAAQWPRVVDPAKFMHDVLDHLPDELVLSLKQRNAMLAKALIEKAIRLLARHSNQPAHIATRVAVRDIAREAMAQALALNPEEDVEAFAEQVRGRVVLLDYEAPVDLANRVFDNLPSSAQRLSQCRPQVLAQIHTTLAYEALVGSRWSRVPSEVLAAVRANPVLAKQRGLWAMLGRSLAHRGPRSAT